MLQSDASPVQLDHLCKLHDPGVRSSAALPCWWKITFALCRMIIDPDSDLHLEQPAHV